MCVCVCVHTCACTRPSLATVGGQETKARGGSISCPRSFTYYKAGICNPFSLTPWFCAVSRLHQRRKKYIALNCFILSQKNETLYGFILVQPQSLIWGQLTQKKEIVDSQNYNHLLNQQTFTGTLYAAGTMLLSQGKYISCPHRAYSLCGHQRSSGFRSRLRIKENSKD